MSTQKTEKILAYGNPNVQAIHPTTLMFTKDKHLSIMGDCIVAVNADKALADLSPEFKKALKTPNAKLTITIEVDGLKDQVMAFGSPKLTLTDKNDIVVRKSSYICGRTLAIHADKASKDLSRELVQKLKASNNKAVITFTVEC